MENKDVPEAVTYNPSNGPIVEKFALFVSLNFCNVVKTCLLVRFITAN